MIRLSGIPGYLPVFTGATVSGSAPIGSACWLQYPGFHQVGSAHPQVLPVCTCAPAVQNACVGAPEKGGRLQVIPELSYEQFKAFHGKFYHPSNARCAASYNKGV